MRRRHSASSCFYDADTSSESGCSRDQKQPCPDGDAPVGSGDALTGRCETLDGDGCRHDSHRAKVHDPDDQKDRLQASTAVAAVEAEAQAVSPSRDISRLPIALGPCGALRRRMTRANVPRTFAIS
jgi:hypothetical protein